MLNTLLKKTARTLYLSAKILPRGARETFSVAYLLCRAADSIADTNMLAKEKRILWIQKFPLIIEQNNKIIFEEFKKEIISPSQNPHEKLLLENLSLCADELKNLPPRSIVLAKEVLSAVCKGMIFDLTRFPSGETISDDELKEYCAYMGGAPGEFWAKLILLYCDIKEDEKNFIAQGKHIGDAMQITNIIRDIKEDYAVARRYIAVEDVKKHILWGITNVKSAKKFFADIPKRNLSMRASVLWPVLWLLDTYNLLSKENDLLNSQRIKISKLKIYFTFLETPFFLISNKYFNYKINKKIAAVLKNSTR